MSCGNLIPTGCIRFGDKSVNQNEQMLISNYYNEQIQLGGTEVDYFVNTYNTLSANNLFGEHPTKVFHPPKKTILLLELDESSVALTKYGYLADDEITAYIHISAFYALFDGDNIHSTLGDAVEPKAGDVFQLTEYGSTRPGNRGGKLFEITERLDSEISRINPLAGHYVWLIKAKRFEYSFEPGLSAERGSHEVYEDPFAGRLSGGATPPTENKQYDHDIDQISRDTVFNMNNNQNDSIYGDY